MTARDRAVAPTVAVVGSGVIGLSTALRLQQRGHPVRVVADKPGERTTSAVAGATWFPYQVDPPELATGWAAASRPVFEALARQGEQSGVVVRSCAHLWRHPVARRPWWASAIPDLSALPADRLPPGFLDSYRFTQAVIDMPVYLSYLAGRFRAGGGEYVPARLGSLDEASRYGEIVVNCSGLAARTLAGDPDVFPIRGQWLRVANPGIEWVLADFDHPDGEAYVIPHRHSCILGGTVEEGSWDSTASDEVSTRIRQRCVGLDPRLARAAALEQQAGLRPARRGGVRVETAVLPSGTPCVHNYGHGGAGVTLSWGCADDVADMVRSLSASGVPDHDLTR